MRIAGDLLFPGASNATHLFADGPLAARERQWAERVKGARRKTDWAIIGVR
jgi:hypothetical protein